MSARARTPPRACRAYSAPVRVLPRARHPPSPPTSLSSRASAGPTTSTSLRQVVLTRVSPAAATLGRLSDFRGVSASAVLTRSFLFPRGVRWTLQFLSVVSSGGRDACDTSTAGLTTSSRRRNTVREGAKLLARGGGTAFPDTLGSLSGSASCCAHPAPWWQLR